MLRRCSLFVLLTLWFAISPTLAQSLKSDDNSPHDLQFIDIMHHHHADGIMMARHEEEHGQVAEVKALAARSGAASKRTRKGSKLSANVCTVTGRSR